jgi:serpin B
MPEQPTLTEHAGTIRELASRWLDSLLSDPAVRDAGGDVVCSPAGLWLALSALAVGADGETADELADLLGVATPEAAGIVADAVRSIAATSDLNVATGVFAKVPVRDEYQALLPGVSFAPLDDPAAIDAWVREATGGLIEALPSPPNPDVALLLVNALALKATWAKPFDPAQTTPQPFTPATGPAADVPMMRRTVPAADTWTVGYRDGAVTVVELPCAGDSPARVRFALGVDGAPPASVMAAAWGPRHLGEPVEEDRVVLRLPRFALRTNVDVTAHLEALGVHRALSGKAEFDLISPVALKLDQVVQESLIRVREEGVEAAAVTQAAMTRMSARTDPPLEVTFNRPFACAVIDASGTVPLFSAYQAGIPQAE